MSSTLSEATAIPSDEAIEVEKPKTSTFTNWMSLPIELRLHIMSFMEPAELKTMAMSSGMTDLVESVLWKDITVSIPGADQEKVLQCRDDPEVSGQVITQAWQRLASMLERRHCRKEYIRSITYPMASGAITTAANLLPQLAGLLSITDHTAQVTYGRRKPLRDEETGPSIAALTKCRQMSSVQELVLVSADGSSADLFCALHNFPNLVQLSTSLYRRISSKVTTEPPNMPFLTTLFFNLIDRPKVAIALLRQAPQVHTLVSFDHSSHATTRPAELDEIFLLKQIHTLCLGGYGWDFISDSGRLGADCVPNLETLDLCSNVNAGCKWDINADVQFGPACVPHHLNLRQIGLHDYDNWEEASSIIGPPVIGCTMPVADWLVQALKRAPRLCYVQSKAAQEIFEESSGTQNDSILTGLRITTFTDGMNTLVHARQHAHCINEEALEAYTQELHELEEPYPDTVNMDSNQGGQADVPHNNGNRSEQGFQGQQFAGHSNKSIVRVETLPDLTRRRCQRLEHWRTTRRSSPTLLACLDVSSSMFQLLASPIGTTRVWWER